MSASLFINSLHDGGEVYKLLIYHILKTMRFGVVIRDPCHQSYLWWCCVMFEWPVILSLKCGPSGRTFRRTGSLAGTVNVVTNLLRLGTVQVTLNLN